MISRPTRLGDTPASPEYLFILRHCFTFAVEWSHDQHGSVIHPPRLNTFYTSALLQPKGGVVSRPIPECLFRNAMYIALHTNNYSNPIWLHRLKFFVLLSSKKVTKNTPSSLVILIEHIVFDSCKLGSGKCAYYIPAQIKRLLH